MIKLGARNQQNTHLIMMMMIIKGLLLYGDGNQYQLNTIPEIVCVNRCCCEIEKQR